MSTTIKINFADGAELCPAHSIILCIHVWCRNVFQKYGQFCLPHHTRLRYIYMYLHVQSHVAGIARGVKPEGVESGGVEPGFTDVTPGDSRYHMVESDMMRKCVLRRLMYKFMQAGCDCSIIFVNTL